ncbi:DNA polymerase I [Quillaja saponaria]|uniref:DNA-directed DNA polymerase n=1 Tax=Quillaja saponaria TaxID=32244 RepID=A0AAD7PM76_QUISA|nr:DNA polymerase I [Quillaja saponaria]
MAMGVSTQTSPLRPYCPSCVWFSQCYPRTSVEAYSSRSLLGSSKVQQRQMMHTVQNSTNSFHNFTMFSSSLQFRQSSCYQMRTAVEMNKNNSMGRNHKFLYRIPGSALMRFSTSSTSILEEMLEEEELNSMHHNEPLGKVAFVPSCRPKYSPTVARTTLFGDRRGWETATDNLRKKKKSDVRKDANAYTSNQFPLSCEEQPVSKNGVCNLLVQKNHVETLPSSTVLNNSKVLTDSELEKTQFKGSFLGNSGEKYFDEVIGDKGADTSEKDAMSAKYAREAHSGLKKKLCSIYDDVLIVDDFSVAKEVVDMLTNKYRHHVHACDTEVAKIDVKQETPVDHGEVICFSIYSGPDADFGNGKSCIWVDVLDGGGRELLVEFAPFFKDPSIKKVWHNYSFDNHIIENYGFKVSGFHADTMHMARLWDSSRRVFGGYSLEALTSDPKVMSLNHEELIGKVSMKKIFGRKKLKKDGSEGKISTIAPVEELQREERIPWICYSVLDAKSTLKLYENLKIKLSEMPWKKHGEPISGNMFNFYERYWCPFGELLIQMESEGMLVDRAYLADIEKVAKAEQEVAGNRFRKWASRYCPDAKYMNVGSDAQLRQLLFGGIANRKDPNVFCPTERIFKVPNVDKVIEEGKKTPTKYRKIKLNSLDVQLPTDMFTATGWPSVSGDALKVLAGNVSSEYDFIDDDCDLQQDDTVGDTTESKVSDEDSTALEDVDNSAYGTAFAAFANEEEGREACHAIAALCEVCSIDSLISNFILPLQGSNISGKNGRVHCSLNINTETGRLSARRPNLQNQPALEKDRYKIRQAFIAAPGNSLIVADYGQLELRILAHLASCKSMLEAFKAGGDFHSRTAMNMYPYIREAVEKMQVLLEWHPQPGEDKPPVPLLKDAFGSERRKAKMLNFSIAYGKTPMGLARDWKVSVKEAKKTVDLWYGDRKEVLEWQEERKKEANIYHRVHTLLGRARRFPSMHQATNYQKGHIERAAINTPVQGSAADVAMCAMLEISRNTRLKELGWKLLLQVHDEVILEGPTETAEIAKNVVDECMSKPFNGKNILQVDLAVDAKFAQNWYSAK